MALQDPVDSDSYLIVIKNGSADSILSLVIGDGEKPELHIADFAVPRQILGPPGWEAASVFKEQSMFMHWAWTAQTRAASLPPGVLVSGFRVVLPRFPEALQKNVFPDMTPVKPVNVAKLPFQVYFADRSCVWGRIRPLVIGAPAR